MKKKFRKIYNQNVCYMLFKLEFFLTQIPLENKIWMLEFSIWIRSENKKTFNIFYIYV